MFYATPYLRQLTTHHCVIPKYIMPRSNWIVVKIAIPWTDYSQSGNSLGSLLIILITPFTMAACWKLSPSYGTWLSGNWPF